MLVSDSAIVEVNMSCQFKSKIDMIKGIANINGIPELEWNEVQPHSHLQCVNFHLCSFAFLVASWKRINTEYEKISQIVITRKRYYDSSILCYCLPKSVWKSWVSRVSSGRGQNNNRNKNAQIHFVCEIGWLYTSLYKWSILLFHLFVY